jgi:predicted nucleic acid-binding protein
MRYVLDASVALKWVLDEPEVDRALFLLKEYQLGAVELIAPDIFPVEIAHVLSKGFRQSKLTAAEADAHLASLLTTLPQLVPSIHLLPRAFAIAQETKTALYDALYLALGESENTAVLTADLRLAKLPYNIIAIEKLPYPTDL